MYGGKYDNLDNQSVNKVYKVVCNECTITPYYKDYHGEICQIVKINLSNLYNVDKVVSTDLFHIKYAYNISLYRVYIDIHTPHRTPPLLRV